MREIALNQHVLNVLRPALKGAERAILKELERGNTKLYALGEVFLIVRFEPTEFVVVALAGRNLSLYSFDIAEFARSKGYTVVRYHTRNPERLVKGLKGLVVRLVDVRRRFLGADEYVYKVMI